jgi:predicted DsbA family dithiol-disulfide isomerase
MSVRITYFIDVLSSWCHWAEPAWAELQRRYQGRVEFDWKIALMDDSNLPVSRAQEEWFYRRSGTIVRSPDMLRAEWMEPGIKEYFAPNGVAVAARDLGAKGDAVRLALAHAAMREGQQVGRWDVAAAVGAKAAGIDADILLAHARTPELEKTVRDMTAEFAALQIHQRPAFVIESDIGDRAVFSGVWRAEPLIATMDAMLEDAAAYASWRAHFGDPPKE